MFVSRIYLTFDKFTSKTEIIHSQKFNVSSGDVIPFFDGEKMKGAKIPEDLNKFFIEKSEVKGGHKLIVKMICKTDKQKKVLEDLKNHLINKFILNGKR